MTAVATSHPITLAKMNPLMFDLVDLCTLLLQFRTHKFALVTDIEKAFLYAQLAEADHNYTHTHTHTLLLAI